MEAIPSSKRGISGSTLKLIAIAAMALDHIAWCLIDPQLSAQFCPTFPQLAPFAALQESPSLYILSYLFHIFGRITFPLMLFFLTEGLTHTRNIYRYGGSLLVFAFLSEIPFDLAFSGTAYDPAEQNVFFTLFLCLIAMYAIRKLPHRPALTVLIVLLCGICAWLLRSDYGHCGVISACVMELLRKEKSRAYSLGCVTATLLSPWECAALMALPAVQAYNGSRGRRLKYAFYLFYPLHLLFLYALKSHFL